MGKPPRIRAACSQCHNAKIRCSGEKTGCARCLDNDLSCEYTVSMVGRTSSRDKRAKANKRPRSTTSSSAPDPTTHESPSSGNSQDGRQNQDPPGSLPDFPFPTPDLTFSSWGNSQSPDPLDLLMQTDFQDGMHLAHGHQAFLTPDSNGEANHASNRSGDFSLELPNIDLNMDQYSMPDFADLDPTTSAPPVPPTLSDPSSIDFARRSIQAPELVGSFPRPPPKQAPNRVTGRAQYAHVLVLVEVIGSLETQVQSKEAAVDKILRLNKGCIASIKKIVALEDKLCKICRALIPTALELVVSLYETTLSKDNGTPRSRNLANLAHHRSTNLQFGVFAIEPEDQVAFTNQLVVKELRRCIQIIQFLTAQSREAAGVNAICGSVMWYTKMEQRAKNVVQSLGGREELG